LSGSSKKIIPIIIVAVIAIGALAIISNSATTQDQVNQIEQADFSEKIEESIQEIEDVSESESSITSKLESDTSQTEEIEKANIPAETLGPIQEIKETPEPESAPASKIESNQPPQLRAVIIDQLHDEVPNHDLQSNATRMLEDAGYQVDLFTTKDVTVEFYKNLPSMNYHFILIRTHGGEDLSDDNPTFLFTGEKYSQGKYTIEQISRQVGYGIPIYTEEFEELKENDPDIFDKAYFTVGAKMVKDGMVGNFPDSIILVGGCESARSHDLMESMIRRGAGSVLGWGQTIRALDNDKAMISFLEETLVNKVPLYDAVEKINQDLVPEFKYPATLKLFNAA
jgi:hypothetical protein